MHKRLLAVAALQVLLAVTKCMVYRRLSKRQTITDTGTQIEICTQTPIDLGIVLDSGYIRNNDSQIVISFLLDFLDMFDIRSEKEGVRVSIITYGRGLYIQDGFNLTTYGTKKEVLEAVSRILLRAGLRTDTGKAIKYMHEVQLADDVVRPWAEKISIVITGGNTQDPNATLKAAEEARQDGITMFAIGVGSRVKIAELLRIAGDDSRVTRVKNYDQLASIKETLASKTCIKKKPTTTPETMGTEKEKATTTPETMGKKCGEVNPRDVYFTFSPANLGEEAIAWATAFIGNIINSEDLHVGFRYGIVSGSCPDDESFDLNTYNPVEEYKARLEQYQSNPVPQLIKRWLGDAYSVERGVGRDASIVTVIVTSGQRDVVEELSACVDQLLGNKVTVYIADLSDSGVTIDGAVNLTGTACTQAETLVSYLCPE